MSIQIEHKILNDSSWAGLIRASFGLSIIALGFCGFIYSAIGTGLAQIFFPEQANGSLIIQNDQVVGSKWVAQPFVQNQYFQARPSIAHYDPMVMSGSNMARTNPELRRIVDERIHNIAIREQVNPRTIPADLVTASGSGIDPDISIESALIQAKRIAKARHMSELEVVQLIEQSTLQPTFGILGQSRVNVLELNMVLDQIKK